MQKSQISLPNTQELLQNVHVLYSIVYIICRVTNYLNVCVLFILLVYLYTVYNKITNIRTFVMWKNVYILFIAPRTFQQIRSWVVLFSSSSSVTDYWWSFFRCCSKSFKEW